MCHQFTAVPTNSASCSNDDETDNSSCNEATADAPHPIGSVSVLSSDSLSLSGILGPLRSAIQLNNDAVERIDKNELNEAVSMLDEAMAATMSASTYAVSQAASSSNSSSYGFNFSNVADGFCHHDPLSSLSLSRPVMQRDSPSMQWPRTPTPLEYEVHVCEGSMPKDKATATDGNRPWTFLFEPFFSSTSFTSASVPSISASAPYRPESVPLLCETAWLAPPAFVSFPARLSSRLLDGVTCDGSDCRDYSACVEVVALTVTYNLALAHQLFWVGHQLNYFTDIAVDNGAAGIESEWHSRCLSIQVDGKDDDDIRKDGFQDQLNDSVFLLRAIELYEAVASGAVLSPSSLSPMLLPSQLSSSVSGTSPHTAAAAAADDNDVADAASRSRVALVRLAAANNLVACRTRLSFLSRRRDAEIHESSRGYHHHHGTNEHIALSSRSVSSATDTLLRSLEAVSQLGFFGWMELSVLSRPSNIRPASIVATSLSNAGLLHYHSCRIDDARRCYNVALAVEAASIGVGRRTASMLFNLGYLRDEAEINGVGTNTAISDEAGEYYERSLRHVAQAVVAERATRTTDVTAIMAAGQEEEEEEEEEEIDVSGNVSKSSSNKIVTNSDLDIRRAAVIANRVVLHRLQHRHLLLCRTRADSSLPSLQSEAISFESSDRELLGLHNHLNALLTNVTIAATVENSGSEPNERIQQHSLAEELDRTANAHVDREEHDVAIVLLLECLRLRKNICGSYGRHGGRRIDPNYVVTLNDIGQAYHSRGQRGVALEFYKKGRELLERISEEDHDSRSLSIYATLWYNTGLIRMESNLPHEALHCFATSLELRELRSACLQVQVQGIDVGVGAQQKELRDIDANDNDHDTDVHASTLHNAGVALLELGRPREALDALFRSLEIRRRSRNVDIRDLADTLDVTANAQANLGDAEGALSSRIEAYRLESDLCGLDSIEAAIALCCIAQARHAVSDLDGALRAYQEAWGVMSALYSPVVTDLSPFPSSTDDIGPELRGGIPSSRDASVQVSDLISILGEMASIHLERGEIAKAEACNAELFQLQGVETVPGDCRRKGWGNISAPAA